MDEHTNGEQVEDGPVPQGVGLHIAPVSPEFGGGIAISMQEGPDAQPLIAVVDVMSARRMCADILKFCDLQQPDAVSIMFHSAKKSWQIPGQILAIRLVGDQFNFGWAIPHSVQQKAPSIQKLKRSLVLPPGVKMS